MLGDLEYTERIGNHFANAYDLFLGACIQEAHRMGACDLEKKTGSIPLEAIAVSALMLTDVPQQLWSPWVKGMESRGWDAQVDVREGVLGFQLGEPALALLRR